MNIAASLALQLDRTRDRRSNASMEIGLIYLNKILQTSPFVAVHQYLLEAYIASTKINDHVGVTYNNRGSADILIMMITKAYDGLLKVEVDLRETWVKKHQFVTRPANVTSYFARSGQTNPIYAALRQEVGLYEERLTSMA